MTTPPRLDPSAPSGPRHPRLALLVNPFYPKDPHASFGKHVLTPSLALAMLAASTPAEWEVRFFDENLLGGAPPIDPLPAVVGITVHLTFARRAKELARWFRERGCLVVMGGPHVLSSPGELADEADALAIGEGASLWPDILADAARGALRPVYRTDFRTPRFDDLPRPRRDLLPRGSFLTVASVMATRGCHNRCGFCHLSTEGLVMPWQVRDPARVAAEIRELAEPYAVFLDNNLGSDRRHLRALCRELEPLGIVWSAAVSLDVTNDPGLVREMALSGCTGVFVGFESLADSNLADAAKKTPRCDDYARRVALFHDVGIQVNGSFVLGFDDDDPEVFERTAAWIEANRLECATFHILTPYPGTPLFRRLESEGRLLHRDWDLYDTGHAVFRPARMRPEELERGYAWCYERLFSPASIWRRRPADPRAVPAYLLMSLLYKKSNRLWRHLIRRSLVASAWHPLVEANRRRHLLFRRRLASRSNQGADDSGSGSKRRRSQNPEPCHAAP